MRSSTTKAAAKPAAARSGFRSGIRAGARKKKPLRERLVPAAEEEKAPEPAKPTPAPAAKSVALAPDPVVAKPQPKPQPKAQPKPKPKPKKKKGPYIPSKPKGREKPALCTRCFDVPCVCNAPIKALRKPKKFIPPSQRDGKPKRPSLSEQLASIGAKAGSITDKLEKKHGLNAKRDDAGDPMLFQVPSRTFVVGKLETKFPSPVQFYASRCVYVFHHPYDHKVITMEMHYGDMRQARVIRASADRLAAGPALEFKIDHALLQYGKDYDPGRRDHVVSIGLGSGSDADRIRREILPRISGGGGGGGRRRR